MSLANNLLRKNMLYFILLAAVVASGFVLISRVQFNTTRLNIEVDRQVQNVAATRELGQLIGRNLAQISAEFHQLLAAHYAVQQAPLVNSILRHIVETHKALNVLATGGTLRYELALNVPEQSSVPLVLNYVAKPQHYNVPVLTLRPLIASLLDALEQTLDLTVTRNALVNVDNMPALRVAEKKVRIYAEKVTALLTRMQEDANKLAYDAHSALKQLRQQRATIQHRGQRNNILATMLTMLSVLGIIALIYRQKLSADRQLNNAVLLLQQADLELQNTNIEILTLNRSLEDKVDQRTKDLQRSEQQWSDAFDAVRYPIFLHNHLGKIIKVNAAYLEQANCTIDEVYGRCYWEVFPRLDQPLPGCVRDLDETAVDTCTHELDMEVGDKIYRSQSFAVRDDNGAFMYSMHLMEDVTDREKYIQQLSRYQQIISTSTDMIAYVDRDLVYLTVNEVLADYFNTTADQFIGKHLYEFVAEERVQIYLNYSDSVFLQRREVKFKQWIEFPGAGMRHVLTTLTPYIDGDEVGGVVARLTDITELTANEEKLRLAAKVFESTSEGIVITDTDGTIIAVNKAFSSVTGYSEAEAVGQNPRILKSGHHDESFYRIMWQTLADIGQWSGEIWNKRKNGEIYPEMLTVSSIYADDGVPTHYVAVFSDITAMNKVVQQLDYQVHHHVVTDLPNRRLFRARLTHSLQVAIREQHQGALLYLDLDNFKNINDSLGHDVGDMVLVKVAARLKEHLREVDTVAHIGGDEFAVVLNHVSDANNAVDYAQQLLIRLQQPMVVDGHELFITASIGITIFPDDGHSVEVLRKNADAAMYEVKKGGKNSYHCYSYELTEVAWERLQLESSLRRALEKEEFVLYYQPQLSLRTGEIIGCEALVRWQHPESGMVPPDKFIPLCEENGLIVPLGEWVLRTACQQWLEWREQGYELGRIAVNVSGRQIQHQGLVEMVQNVLQQTGCPVSALELEITETFLMLHPEQAIIVLRQLTDLGIELSIDDFGTGQSSLNYLKRFPVSRLKIDRSFVNDIVTDNEDSTIVKAVIAMGHGLDLGIIAEGIETELQRDFLAELGCEEAQGYLFSKPLPADEFTELLKQRG